LVQKPLDMEGLESKKGFSVRLKLVVEIFLGVVVDIRGLLISAIQ